MKKIAKATVFFIVFSVSALLTFSVSKSQQAAINQIRKDYNKQIKMKKNIRYRQLFQKEIE